MYRNGCKRKRNGLVFSAFGAGLLVASCFPTTATVIVLAVVLIILGLIICRNT